MFERQRFESNTLASSHVIISQSVTDSLLDKHYYSALRCGVAYMGFRMEYLLCIGYFASDLTISALNI